MTERRPTGGKRQLRTTASAWLRLSTCGTMTPWAPPSSTRLDQWASWLGTRTSGVMPMPSAAAQIHAQHQLTGGELPLHRVAGVFSHWHAQFPSYAPHPSPLPASGAREQLDCLAPLGRGEAGPSPSGLGG